MPNISNVIEEFIIGMMGEDASLSISRNELAQYFDCAPSQINYVLSTRFTLDKGFVTDSRRGGGGYILLSRIKADYGELLEKLDNSALSAGLTYGQASDIIDFLTHNEAVTLRESRIIKIALSDKTLIAPVGGKDILRANILKNIIIMLMSC